MTETMAFNWRQVDAIVRQTKGELSKSSRELGELNKMVSKWLRGLERLIIGLDQVGRDEVIDELENWTMTGDKYFGGLEAGVDMFPEPWLEPSREEELSYLNEKDGPGLEDQQPQNSLLKRANENLEELKKSAHGKFDSVLESLNAAKNEANERMRYQEEKRERVEINLRNVQESLKDLLKARLSHSRVQSSRPNYIYEPQIQMQIN